MHEKLIKAGFAVFNPILSMRLPFNYPGNPDVEHGTWLDNDLAWVKVSHAVLRMPGESTGADIETEFAKEEGIPVFTDFQEMLQWFKENHNSEYRFD